jgi:hypothetical protein
VQSKVLESGVRESETKFKQWLDAIHIETAIVNVQSGGFQSEYDDMESEYLTLRSSALLGGSMGFVTCNHSPS